MTTQWTEWLATLVIAMMRPMGMFVLFPLFSSRMLGGTLIRNGLAMIIALPALPMLLQASAVQADMSAGQFALLSMHEVVTGLLIGFAAAIPFWAMDMAGYLIDTMRGSSIASVLNPALGDQSSIFGILFAQVLTVVFFVSGGFNTMLTTLYTSYTTMPPQAGLTFDAAFVDFLKSEWRMMFTLCITFSAPSMAVMVLIDMAFGFVNRSVQQLNVFFIAMPVKSGFVLFILAIGISLALAPFQARFAGFGATIGALAEVFRWARRPSSPPRRNARMREKKGRLQRAPT